MHLVLRSYFDWLSGNYATITISFIALFRHCELSSKASLLIPDMTYLSHTERRRPWQLYFLMTSSWKLFVRGHHCQTLTNRLHGSHADPMFVHSPLQFTSSMPALPKRLLSLFSCHVYIHQSVLLDSNCELIGLVAVSLISILAVQTRQTATFLSNEQMVTVFP